ncbi:3-deoxy-D-manno-octulosonic acid transferase [Prosthecomicrobium sp. N25]|uniref:3-deoxy-D-manno-octulosonic acid transferase n=1 Tax=Prosthecomicrobium sp. N25 TaxID=3129254 RepID=UPI003077A111
MADPIARTVLASYRNISRLLSPVVRAWVENRTRLGKEHPGRRSERFGRPNLARPDGPIVWVHAASVGETVSVVPLIDVIAARGLRVLLTTGTLTSAKVAEDRLPPRALHQFAPLDVVSFVARFLNHWQPDLAIFVESEIWPATVSELARRRVPQVVVNARLSSRSGRRWARLGGIARALFGRLALVLAQSQADAERLRLVGAAPVIVTGNLKFDVAPPDAIDHELAALHRQIGDRPVWLAASTHAGEEEAAAAAHAALKARFPGLLTVLVPRHPARGPEIRGLLAARGLAVAARSERAEVSAETDVLLGDTIGEMGLYYRVAPLAFIGGSLVDRGGQNPIEAAALDTAVLHGPHVKNFLDIYRAFDRNNASLEVADADGLEAAVGALLADSVRRGRMAAAGRRLVTANRGALERTLAALEPYLEPLAARASGGGGPP